MKKIVIIISTLLFFTSCEKKVETFDKPEEFITNAKNTDLSILFNTVIQARNESEGAFHYTYVQVFDISGKDTFNLPSFEFYDEIAQPNSLYKENEIYDFAKHRGIDRKLAFNYSKQFTKNIDDLYKKLRAINIVSLPSSGRFIVFTISKQFKVYYLDDPQTLNKYWKDYFMKLKKVEPRWFFEKI